MTNITKTPTPFDYRSAAKTVLGAIRRDRDRQIVSRRFGLGLPKRQTLEQIGRDFGITRERVRQVEKAALGKLASTESRAVSEANSLLLKYLRAEGGVATLEKITSKMGEASDQAYIQLLATLSPDIAVFDEDDQLRQGLAIKSEFNSEQIRALVDKIVTFVKATGQPITAENLSNSLDSKISPAATLNLAEISKELSSLDGKWGLVSWPEVNPKSIRDKTYIVLQKHTEPLHFSDIATKIQDLGAGKRVVTVQAVHNELIKDPRFILIGRGIYALAEWGYAPGTVADIIIDVLNKEQPLHKDEIIKRVLAKRQVKTTTILLNLQEKNQFERVAKATYKLKE